MAGLRELVKGDGDDPALLGRAIVSLTSVYPLVGEMLTGVAAKGIDPAIPKYFLSFSLETDGIVCRCTQKGSDEALYVKIDDPLTPFGCLEAALSGGRYTRRRVDKRTPSF
jgi:hypothetical protein